MIITDSLFIQAPQAGPAGHPGYYPTHQQVPIVSATQPQGQFDSSARFGAGASYNVPVSMFSYN